MYSYFFFFQLSLCGEILPWYILHIKFSFGDGITSLVNSYPQITFICIYIYITTITQANSEKYLMCARHSLKSHMHSFTYHPGNPAG